MQPRGLHQAERAHLTVANGYGPRFVRSEEWVLDPVMSMGWATAMQVMWHLPDSNWVSTVLHTLQDFVTCHNRLYLEQQPHESVAVPGGPPDSIDTWVAPMDKELVI
ncbi:hypothetical protein NDA11_001269 [Ustilago hordei]|uniref:Uncharacterized protein n=1 Tax=Ustilago hordei TaxID=120017 RepID=I2FMF8_USTHO|nr:hypothetical protein NDA15_003668 [Ustilago hordei]KAJ1582901.1 hypothetical protein NDA12_005290 [Ustilago hordei]KAJ1588543.1 hypothetical protein NDA11_001269 [Ustilago hordei]CCF48101.1 uncharacterized protein UHOR_12756 [Ustilago hordei]